VDNSFVIVWMLLVSLVGRVGFRRYGDALDDDIPERKLDEMEAGFDDATALRQLKGKSDEPPSSDGTKPEQKTSESSH
jgi:hypothetical protein